MVLTQELIDREGTHWPMAGLVPGVARMSDRLAALGYRHATALQSNLLVPAGESLRCHEFHYSHWECDADLQGANAWRITGVRSTQAAQVSGYARGSLLASYLHVHFGQHESIAQRFVAQLSAS